MCAGAIGLIVALLFTAMYAAHLWVDGSFGQIEAAFWPTSLAFLGLADPIPGGYVAAVCLANGVLYAACGAVIGLVWPFKVFRVVGMVAVGAWPFLWLLRIVV